MICASTLREEPGPDGRGLDFAIDDQRLRDYRKKTLEFGRQKIIIVSGSGEMDVTIRLFTSPRMEPWILTTRNGGKKLQAQLSKVGRERTVKIICVRGDTAVNLAAAMRVLYEEHRIGRLIFCKVTVRFNCLIDNTHRLPPDGRTVRASLFFTVPQVQPNRPR